MAYLEIKDLTYYYPQEEKKALDDVNINVERGDFILVIGKSGSGKSTLGKAITGAVPNFYGGRIKGSIKLDGELLDKMEAYKRAKNITMVFQDPEKQLVMNKVHREIAFGLENIGEDEKIIKRRVWETMQFCGILNLVYRDINTLSGGEKQKTAVASALSYMPKCIILDEPTSQLDPLGAEEIVSLVRKINEELGITIIVIEQKIDKWFQSANKVAFMESGKLKYYDDKKKLLDDKKIFDFLPDYIKLFENFKFVPRNFKEARSYVENVDINKKNINVKYTHEDLENVISIRKLNSFYGNNHVLKDISLDIKKGECIALMGANGAGKSTFLRAVAGLQKYKGSIKIFNNEVRNTNIKKIAGSVGYVSQNPNDYISKDTVYDELKFTLDNFKNFKNETIEKTLKELEIYELKDKNPRDLSGGEKERVALASVLVNSPEILILDEPTRGMDVYIKKRLGQILKDIQKNGVTIILVTHDTEFAADFCDRFVLMFDGEIMCDGNIDDVMSDGIYYTTSINKLFRYKNKHVFTLNDALKAFKDVEDANEED